MQEAIQAERSDRERLFDYIQTKGVEFDTVYTYEEVEAFLGKPRNVVQNLVWRLNPKLGKVCNRYLKVRPEGGGWRIIRAGEHADVAEDYAEKALAAIKRAENLVKSADVRAMSQKERDRRDMAVAGYNALKRQVKDNTERIQRMEAVQVTHVKVTQTHEERLAELERELAELKRLRAQS